MFYGVFCNTYLFIKIIFVYCIYTQCYAKQEQEQDQGQYPLQLICKKIGMLLIGTNGRKTGDHCPTMFHFNGLKILLTSRICTKQLSYTTNNPLMCTSQQPALTASTVLWISDIMYSLGAECSPIYIMRIAQVFYNIQISSYKM